MKIIDKRETQKQNAKQNKTMGTAAIEKGWEINDCERDKRFWL